MQIGISTACFYPMVTEESLQTIIDLGVRCVEVFFNTRSELRPAYLKELRRVADGNGVRISSVHPYTGAMEPLLFFSQYPRRFEEGLELYREFFQAARLLGAGIVVFHGHTRFGDMPLEEYCRRFARIAAVAEEYGVALCQENVERCQANDHSFFAGMRQILSGAGFVLDVKQAVRAGEDVDKLVKAMGNGLRHIHISDNNSFNSCMLPGRGSFDFAALLRQARQVGFAGDVILELYAQDFDGPSQLLDGYQHLIDILLN